jgi:hypothetical protein
VDADRCCAWRLKPEPFSADRPPAARAKTAALGIHLRIWQSP